MALRVTLDLFTRDCSLFLTKRPEASADKSNVTRGINCFVITRSKSTSVSELIVYIRYTLYRALHLPVGHKPYLIVGKAGTTVPLCAMKFGCRHTHP